MKLKNFLIVVSDIEQSVKFYCELFGLYVVRDFGENVILSQGLVLQEQKTWENVIERPIVKGGNDAVIYFEESSLDGFLEKIDKSDFEIEFIDRCKTHSWGRRVVRLYDPDGHIVEVVEPVDKLAT